MNTITTRRVLQSRPLQGEHSRKVDRERQEQRRARVKALCVWAACAVGVLAMWWPK